MLKTVGPLLAAIALPGLLAGSPAGALAQSLTDPQWHMMRGVGPMLGIMAGDCPMLEGADMPSFIEGRIAFLKAELAITDAQKDLWVAYAAALRTNFQSMHAMRRTMKTPMSDMTTVEQLHAQLTVLDARVQALTDVKPSLTALYAALSADQKTKADQLLTPMGCMM